MSVPKRRTSTPGGSSCWSSPALVLPAALVLLALGAHAVTLGGDFVFDDRFLIVRNDYLPDPARWGRFFTEGAWAGAGIPASTYRPLPLLTYGLNHQLGGLHPAGYHVVNLLIHGLTALLLFGLARKLELSRAAAWLGAAAFAVHPLVSEPVAEIVGRMDLMAGAAFLGGLLCHVTARRRQAEDRPATGRQAAALALYAAAVLSKEHALVLPAVALCYDLAWGAWRPPGRRVPVYAGYLLVAGGYLAMRLHALGSLLAAAPIPFQDNPLAHVAGPVRLISALWVGGLYLVHCVWPLGLSPDYGHAEIVPFASATSPGALAVWAMAALAAAAAVLLARRSRQAALALALAGLAFLPVSNLPFAIGTIMGDRLFYLPLAGLALLLALGWERLAPRLGPAAPWTAGAGILMLLALTVMQDLRWRDDLTLNRYAVGVAPRSARIRNNLGQDLLEAGDLQGAATHLRESLALYPDQYKPLAGLTKVALQQGDPEAALGYATAALEIDPQAVEALDLAAVAEQRRGHAAAARRRWERLLEIEPGNSSTLSNLAILAWTDGDRERALDLWERAVQIPGASPSICLNLARGYDRAGRWEEAVETYQRCLSLDGTTPETRSSIGARLKELRAKEP